MVAGCCPAGSCRAQQGCGGLEGDGWVQAAVQKLAGKPGHAQKSTLWHGKGVREKLDPSLNRKWVFRVLVSLGLLVQGRKVSGPMDAYKYPVTYVLRHKFKTTFGKITEERAKF